MYSSIKILQSTSWAIYLKYDGSYTNATDYIQLYDYTQYQILIFNKIEMQMWFPLISVDQSLESNILPINIKHISIQIFSSY